MNKYVKIISIILFVSLGNLVIVYGSSIKKEERKILQTDLYTPESFYLIEYDKGKFDHEIRENKLNIENSSGVLDLNIENQNELDAMLFGWQKDNDKLTPPDNCNALQLRISHQLKSSYILTTAFLGTTLTCV